MQRRLIRELELWKDKPGRKPLVLQGAGQVGKTHLLREFGRQCFENTVYVNLEADQAVAAEFGRELDPRRLLRFLETAANARIVPGKTLIILDEIQSTGRALTALKYFRELAPAYHVAAAGSLLGVATNDNVNNLSHIASGC
jgi:predicted AAA+ superfamily ATPase